MKNFGLTVLLLIAQGIVACQSSEKAMPVAQFDEDVTIKTTDGDVTKVLRGKKHRISDKVASIERSGKLPVILLPVPSAAGDMKIKLPSIVEPQCPLQAPPTQCTEAHGKVQDKDFNRILADIMDIQSLVAMNQPAAAVTKVQSLVSRNPDLTYLLFLEASCHFMAGNKTLALRQLKTALAKHPQDPQGIALLKILESNNSTNIKSNASARSEDSNNL